MSAHRFIGVSALLVAVASCATHNSPSTTAAPKTGPKASIHATYDGGMLNRTADAVFRVDQSAYVMVAHLGGDGRIEVIYPDDARESGYVPAGKWYRTPSFSAYYDAFPQMYSFATTRYRGVGAQLDSYDGLGHGFVFLIASRAPLRFDRISEFGLWNDYEAENYSFSPDPRSAIRAFADMVAGRRDYTLKFASSMGSTAMTSAIDQSFDCAYLQTFNLGAMGTPWLFQYSYLGLFSPLRSLQGCGNRYALSGYAPRYAFAPQTSGFPTNPNGTPPFFRPGFRPRDKDGPALGFNRPTHRAPTTATSTSTGFSGPERRRGFGPPSGELGGRDFDARPAPRTAPSFGSPRVSPSAGSGSADGRSAGAGSSSPRSSPAATQPASHPQPVPNVRVEKPTPDERKP